MRKKNTAGIIVATGYDTLGKMVSPLESLGASTLVRRLLVSLQLANISPIIVITGFNGLSVERHLANYGAVFFRMHDFTSINLKTDVFPAIKYASDKCGQILFAPVEYALVEKETIWKLINTDGKMRVPEYRGYTGRPIAMDADILSGCDERKAESVHTFEDYLVANNVPVTKVAVEDEGVICRCCVEEISEHILKWHDEQMLHPYVRLDIDYAAKVFDLRMKNLLMQIHDTGSMKNACQRIAISIGKAWEQINILEDALGYKVVQRRHGGHCGGSTELTKKGREYLRRYIKLEADVRKYANERFEEIFGKDEKNG